MLLTRLQRSQLEGKRCQMLSKGEFPQTETHPTPAQNLPTDTSPAVTISQQLFMEKERFKSPGIANSHLALLMVLVMCTDKTTVLSESLICHTWEPELVDK